MSSQGTEVFVKVVDLVTHDPYTSRLQVKTIDDLKCIEILSKVRLQFVYAGSKVCWISYEDSRVNIMDSETDLLFQFGLEDY
jgi:hypothetical protein